MAVAANYAGPTAEQLRAAAEGPPYGLHGLQLVEVFSVRATAGRGQPPCGSITVSDGKRSQVLYSRDEPSRHRSDNQDALVLTGPHRVISAYGSFLIELDLNDGSEHSSEDEADIGKIFWDVYDTNAEYDKPLSQTVNTRYGPVEVIYAVLRNAVEADVQVKLVSRDDGEDPTKICGKIIAQNKLFDIGIVLFNSEDDDDMVVSSQEQIPLARSIVAVPLGWPLIVDVDLHSSSGDEIVKRSKEFYPELDGTHIKRFISKNGEIEVKITWSDYW